MGSVIRDVSELLDISFPAGSCLLLDASVLLEICDLDHPNYQQSLRFFQELALKENVACRFVLATRLYVRDLLRRRFLTDFLRAHLSRNVHAFNSTSLFDAEIERCLFHCHTDSSGLAILSDFDFSAIRSACFRCFPTLEEGVRQWQFICQIALGKRMEIVSQRLASLRIRYIDLTELGVSPGGKQPQWRKQEELMLQYGLSSSDTAIVSLLEATDRIFAIVSNSPDLIELLHLRGHLKNIESFTFVKSAQQTYARERKTG